MAYTNIIIAVIVISVAIIRAKVQLDESMPTFEACEQLNALPSRVKATTVVKLLATFMIGIITGAAGASLAAAQERMYHAKNNAAREIIHDGLPHGILRAFFFHLAYTEALVLIGASLVMTHLHPLESL